MCVWMCVQWVDAVLRSTWLSAVFKWMWLKMKEGRNSQTRHKGVPEEQQNRGMKGSGSGV